MKRLLVNLTEQELAKLEKLLKKKIYSSRSDTFREAIELLFEAEKSPELRRIVEKLRHRRIELRLSGRAIREKLMSFLEKHPSGASISQVSEATKLHRHTVRKYLSGLIKSKIVYQKKVGVSRLSFVTVSGRRSKWLR